MGLVYKNKLIIDDLQFGIHTLNLPDINLNNIENKEQKKTYTNME